jgi:hypothetical protein
MQIFFDNLLKKNKKTMGVVFKHQGEALVRYLPKP